MAGTNSSIISHYGTHNLVDRILDRLETAGYVPSNLTVDILNKVDQLHGGGLNSTKTQAELAGVDKNMRVLDAGCGIGGSSRYLTHTYGCYIEAIDLTPEYVEAATRLNELVGLREKISVKVGSVTDLPYDDQSFDLVWCQNVSMNVEDKSRMFAEAYRTLKPGGRYTFSHAALGPAGQPYYPLPWAMDPTYSFLGTPAEVLALLDEAGFQLIVNDKEGGGAGGKKAQHPAGSLGPAAIMGADMPDRMANSARSAQEDRLVSMLVVADRPVG